MQVDFSFLTALVNVGIAVAGFFIGRQTAAKQDGQSSGVIISELGYIKSSVDDLKRNDERSEARHIDVITRLTAVEASSKQAHKRIDDQVGGRQ